MKWFDRWFSNKCAEAWEDARTEKKSRGSLVKEIGEVSGGNTISANGLMFTIYPANGGHVVEFRKREYSNHPVSRSDENPHSLYVISADKDLGESLTHIMTLELLKR
jgi:hypothetical protein